MKFIFSFCILFFGSNLLAQEDTIPGNMFRTHEDTLEVLSDGIISEDQHERLKYCELFIKKLVSTLKIEKSYYHEFKYFNNISVVPSGDDNFRIFTWQLEVEEGEYRYYGAIQTKDNELKLFPLIDRSFEMQNPQTAEVSNREWYGVVYYHCIPFVFNDQTAYLLFGYDMNDYYNRIKVLDVLTFDADGNPKFGAPAFKYPNDVYHNRLMVTFASDAQVRLNFDDKLGMIVFDHLIKTEGSERFVPDGSYSGFKFKDGYWNFQEKIFDEVSAKPPHEVPLTEEKLKLVKPDPTKRKY